MDIQQIGEFGFIDRISSGCLIRPNRIVKAIGDDAAAFRTEADRLTLVTTDLLVERIHFIKEATSGFNLGYKALAVNLSDIAAMGGIAREAFVSIAIPDDCAVDYLEDLYRGMKHLAAEFDVNILGGDTTRSKTDLVINIMMTGSVAHNCMLQRSSARVGDIIFSTGFLGDSRAGLHLILNRITPDSDELTALIDAHLLPKPYLKEGQFLSGSRQVHAAIDVSDGLSSDLGHIVQTSHVGARLYARQIPISPYLLTFCSRFNFDPVEYALAGGEDYTLLCTAGRESAEDIARQYQKRFSQPLYAIGEINDSQEIELVEEDGRVRVISPTGWNHFNPDVT
jgi:thiamine-monophosphate kinase